MWLTLYTDIQLVFNIRRRPLNGYYLRALSFLQFKELELPWDIFIFYDSIWWSVVFISNFVGVYFKKQEMREKNALESGYWRAERRESVLFFRSRRVFARGRKISFV